MSRLGFVGTQYFDENGDPLAGGKMFFYEPGTSTLSGTFSDSAQTIANANPVILTADGRQPDIFYDGQRRCVITDANDVVVDERDPVGDESAIGGINDLSNVNISAPADNQILQYDAPSQEWRNESAATGVTSLGDLSDVTLTSLSDGEILQYDTVDSMWKNEPEPAGGGGDEWWLYEGIIRQAGGVISTVDTHYFYEEDGAYTITLASPKSGGDNSRMMFTLTGIIDNTFPKITIQDVFTNEIGFLGYDVAQNGDNVCQSAGFIFRDGAWIPYLSHKRTIGI